MPKGFSGFSKEPRERPANDHKHHKLSPGRGPKRRHRSGFNRSNRRRLERETHDARQALVGTLGQQPMS